jgi:iron complex transport system ATP-binding protein
MHNSSTVIHIVDLSVERDTTILNHITWQVSAGQNWIILGANGSGKTSLLNTLTAYMAPTSGDIFLCGKKYGEGDWPDLRKKIGIVSTSIHQRISQSETALETVVSGKYAMINYYDKIRSADRKLAVHILEEVECDHLSNRRWGHLSQGEKQRVLIGRALMADLKLLILDEPCVGLDPVARERFLEFIERFMSQKAAPPVILVTHHVEEITPSFSHVLVLKDGCVLANGTKNTVMNSSTLSDALDSPVILTKQNGRYYMQVEITHEIKIYP